MRDKKGAVLSDHLLCQQALSYRDIIVSQLRQHGYDELADKYGSFSASAGWIQKFKQRYGLHS